MLCFLILNPSWGVCFVIVIVIIINIIIASILIDYNSDLKLE